MKPLKSNACDGKKFVPEGKRGSALIPNPEKYTGKVSKGELNDKNRHSTI